jgi:3' exoribonuclease, RNase T-like
VRYWYDTEFVDDGSRIEFISIGIVAEDGREYYAVNESMDWIHVISHRWLYKNVVPYLPVVPRFDGSEFSALLDISDPAVKRKPVIASEVHEFLTADGGKRASRELWGFFADYDHVVLCQLWGPMVDLPRSIPMFTLDIKQEHERLGRPRLPKQADGHHHALADARHHRVMHLFLEELAQERV